MRNIFSSRGQSSGYPASSFIEHNLKTLIRLNESVSAAGLRARNCALQSRAQLRLATTVKQHYILLVTVGLKDLRNIYTIEADAQCEV